MKEGDKVLIKKPEIEDEIVNMCEGEEIIELKEYGYFHLDDIEELDESENENLDEFFG